MSLPLSTVERRFWLIHQLHPLVPVANIGRIIDISGPLDVNGWRAAFRATAEAPMLRARVREEHGEPRLRLGAPAELELGEASSSEQVQRAVDEVVRAPYDLARGPLFRGLLLRLGTDEHRLILGAHHLVLDGWGISRSVPRALAASLRGASPRYDEEAWIRWRREPSPTERADEAYWQNRLDNANTLTLPSMHAAPRRPTGRAHDVEIAVPRALFERAEALAASLDAKLVHVLLATWGVDLARAARSSCLVFGSTSAARPTTVEEDGLDARSFGCYVRTRILRADFTAESSFADLVHGMRSAVREAREHPGFDVEDLPFLRGAPDVTAIFNYIPFPAFDGDIAGLRIHGGRIISGGTATPAALTLDVCHDPPRAVVELSADLFDRAATERMAHRFVTLLAAAVDEPQRTMGRLPRLCDADRGAAQRLQPTPTERDTVTGGVIAPLLLADLTQHPERPALVHGDRSVTRRDLLARTEAIANGLAAAGVGPGDRVLVRTRDPIATVEAILGTLFAGGCYVPTDPAAPERRLENIVATTAPRFVVDDETVGRLAEHRVAAPPRTPARPVDAAYVIFTSGSTGRPKGVVISQDALVAQLQARQALSFPRVVRSILLAPFFFDGSIETLFWTLTTGGTLHLLDESERRDPALVRRTLAARRITYTSAVPALWSAILDADARSDDLRDLAFVIVGGESLSTALIDKHRRHATARLVNEYGPTETTVFATAWTVPEGTPDRILIGRAAPHVRCAVVDENLSQLPIGEPGELIVWGKGLADGYLAEPELTARAFVENPFGPGRAYRTGDIVRLLDDGNLEWLARSDDQVKLRGVRVEPGEVEAALLSLPGVKEAAAVVRGDSLVAWVAPGPIDESAVLQHLSAQLPEAMMPARVLALPALPKTASEKLDKSALPAVDVDEPAFEAPATDSERAIAAVWEEVLGKGPISVTRSFFSYGGHSLSAAQLASRLHQRLSIHVPLSMLMTARTVRALAQQLAGAGGGTSLIVPLHEAARSDAPMVVFLPGVGGHVFTFAGIAARLPLPSVGIRSLGSEPGEEPLTTIEDIAARNIEELERLGLRDVAIAGYSFGGAVAYEMCVQLEARGRTPRHLFVFDALAPGYPRPLPVWRRALIHARTFASLDGEGRRAYLRDRRASIEQKIFLALGRGDALTTDEEMAGIEPSRREALRRLWGLSSLAHHRYWPRSKNATPMTVFAAATGFDWAATELNDEVLGWGEWITAPVDRVVLMGTHLSIFSEENLDLAATAISRSLRRERERAR